MSYDAVKSDHDGPTLRGVARFRAVALRAFRPGGICSMSVEGADRQGVYHTYRNMADRIPSKTPEQAP